jgi:hypothetical protein
MCNTVDDQGFFGRDTPRVLTTDYLQNKSTETIRVGQVRVAFHWHIFLVLSYLTLHNAYASPGASVVFLASSWRLSTVVFQVHRYLSLAICVPPLLVFPLGSTSIFR